MIDYLHYHINDLNYCHFKQYYFVINNKKRIKIKFS
jgi:hypothetical protein